MESFRVFSSVAAAIFLEAMPFLAVGALLSGTIEVLVKPDRLIRRIPKSTAGGIALGVAAGFVLPTCECGVVPIVRRLIRKGVPAPMAIAYMLAAPILNPVVLVSTWVAFRGSLAMLLGRAGVAIVVAVALGIVARKLGPALRSNGLAAGDPVDGHRHESGDGCEAGRAGAIREILLHAGHDFVEMGKFLVLGAMAAACFKTFLPLGGSEFLGASLLLSVGGMMLLAFLLSVCSEADAFVAASFAGLDSAAYLAFVTFGPMLDLKLVGMYFATFRRPLAVALIVVPTGLVFGMSLVFAAINGG